MIFIHIKNFEKFQASKNGKMEGPVQWIKDATSKEADYQYSKLTCVQRYLLDALRRLRGATGKDTPLDPAFIARKLDLLPTDRKKLPKALARLATDGLIIMVDEQSEPVGRGDWEAACSWNVGPYGRPKATVLGPCRKASSSCTGNVQEPCRGVYSSLVGNSAGVIRLEPTGLDSTSSPLREIREKRIDKSRNPADKLSNQEQNQKQEQNPKPVVELAELILSLIGIRKSPNQGWIDAAMQLITDFPNDATELTRSAFRENIGVFNPESWISAVRSLATGTVPGKLTGEAPAPAAAPTKRAGFDIRAFNQPLDGYSVEEVRRVISFHWDANPRDWFRRIITSEKKLRANFSTMAAEMPADYIPAAQPKPRVKLTFKADCPDCSGTGELIKEVGLAQVVLVCPCGKQVAS
jgi:hypothetical protein